MDKTIMFKVGKKYGGPVLCRYIHWLLNECIDKKINRLYFIARDGYVLKEIAEQFIQEDGLDIATHYIYGSRIAWQQYNHIDEFSDLISAKIGKNETYDSETIMKILPVKKRYLEVFEKGEKYTGYYICTELFELVTKYGKDVIEDELYTKKIMLEYIEQEIDIDDSRFALVDIQGTGRTIDYFASIINKAYEGIINCFYCYRTSYVGKNKNVYFHTMMPLDSKTGYVEMLARAPHRTTIGYIWQKNRVIPVLDKKYPLEISDEEYIAYLDGINTYIDECEGDYKIERLNDSREEIRKHIEAISNEEDDKIENWFQNIYAVFQYGLTNISELSGVIKSYSKIYDNIILYGAGKMGRKLYMQLKDNKNILLWVDKHPKKHIGGEVDIHFPKEISSYKYDQIVIAIGKYEIALEIYNELISTGIDGTKIIWIIPNELML